MAAIFQMFPDVIYTVNEITKCVYHVFQLQTHQIGPVQRSPDSKVHWASMGPTWGRQDPGGPYVGHMDLAIQVLKCRSH